MKNLYFVLQLGLFFCLQSCCFEDSIVLEGKLVNGITAEPLTGIELKVEGLSTGGFFSFEACPAVQEMTVTDDAGEFSFDYTQTSTSRLSFAGTNNIIFGFPKPGLRVTELDGEKVWDNNSTIGSQVIERPLVPNQDLNESILVEVLPVIIISTFKSSDTTKIVNSLIIKDLNINYQGRLEGENLRFDRFLEEVENNFLVEVNYSNGESLDSMYSYDIFDASTANVIIEY